MADRAVVIGAGVGGLVSALLLACRGLEVTLVEAAPGPGGKMRQIALGDVRVDAGPTVFTMRWVFEQILADAGSSVDGATSPSVPRRGRCTNCSRRRPCAAPGPRWPA